MESVCLLDFSKGLAPPPPMNVDEAAQLAQLETFAQELYTTQDSQRRSLVESALGNAVAASTDTNGSPTAAPNNSSTLKKCLALLRYTKSQYLSVTLLVLPHFLHIFFFFF